MTDDWNVAEGDPWSVSCRPKEFTHVVRLRVGDFSTIALSALSAHKLGSALHAASGLDVGGHDRQRVGQQYLSNACIHDQHDRCDEECIYCHDGCACSCHPWNAELSTDETEPSHYVPDAEMGGDEPVGISLRGSARPVQPAGRPPDTVRPEGVEREALEGQHAQDDTGPTS
jgi:hypothetical protein